MVNERGSCGVDDFDIDQFFVKTWKLTVGLLLVVFLKVALVHGVSSTVLNIVEVLRETAFGAFAATAMGYQ